MLEKSICLIGYMGAGKTTIGKLLAEKLQLSFHDLDEYIERKEGKSVSKIFKDSGTYYFRKLERSALIELLRNKPAIISLGGGTPCFYDNMDVIVKQSHSFYLRLNPKELALRLEGQTSTRPLIMGKTNEELQFFIEKQLMEREKYYNRSETTIDKMELSKIYSFVKDHLYK